MLHDIEKAKGLFFPQRKENIYNVDFDDLAKQNVKYFASIDESNWLWHCQLGHASMELLRELSYNQHVHDLQS